MKKIILLIAFTSLISFVNGQCQAGFTYTVSGDSVFFNDISTYSTPVYYNWSFGDGDIGWWSSPPANPVPKKYLYAGTYIVSLTISDTLPSTCHSTFCDTITITNGPHYPCDATFSAWVDTSVYFPVQFHNNLSTYYGLNWFWDFGDGSSEHNGNNSTTHQYAAQGSYNVCLTTVTNAGDTCTFCDTVNVIPCSQLLDVSFTHSLNINTVTFTSNCSGSTVSNPWNWNFGDGNNDYSQNPVHTYLNNGTYTVCLTYIGDSTGCSKTFCDTLTITNATPFPCNALFSYHPDTMSTYSIFFNSQSTSNIIHWNWSFPGGTPSSSTDPHLNVSYSAAGTYIAYLTVTNLSGISCSYYDSVYVGANCENTLAYFTMNPTATPQVWNVVNMAAGTLPIAYSWNWGDGSPFSTGVNPSHTYSEAGWYNICLTIADGNGCGSSYCSHDTLYKMSSPNTIISVFVTSPVGIYDNSIQSDAFFLYPNPATDNITLESLQKSDIEIINVQGQVIKNTGTEDTHAIIDISMLARGMYFVKVKTENGIVVKKFIKE